MKALAVKSGMTDSAVASATFIIDTTPPVRSNGAPTGTLAAGTTTATLSLSTDETAACAYSTADVAYASMTAFTATNALAHSTNVIGLTNGTSYTYYVRCRDTLGNANPNSFLISFSVATVPPGMQAGIKRGLPQGNHHRPHAGRRHIEQLPGSCLAGGCGPEGPGI